MSFTPRRLLIAVVLVMLGVVAPARAQDAPTPEQWRAAFEKIDKGEAPASLEEMMASVALTETKLIAPDLPADLKQKLKSKQPLSIEDLNRFGREGQEILKKKKPDAAGEPWEDVAEGSDDAKLIQAMLIGMADFLPLDAAPGVRPGAPAAGATGAVAAIAVWEDYIHYLRIAQTELANANGQKFLATELPPAELIRMIDDTSVYADKWEVELDRASKQDGATGEIAAKVAEKIQQARLELARDPDRIRQAVDKLDADLRPKMLAQQRLNKAGEYAAPPMVAVLTSTDGRDGELRPHVLESLVQIGRPVVAPLCEALLELPPVPKQQVAEVLARIGYPLALPYLKAEIEETDTDAATRAVLQTAYNTIIDRTGVPAASSAAQLFLLLAEDYYYSRESLVLDPEADINLMWTFSPSTGLIPLSVPTAVFGDAQAMRATRRAMEREPSMAAAYSLWIAANFRRENHLAPGQKDPSYGAKMRSPHFYAVLGGPRHLHPALYRSLNDADAELALDIVGALRASAGTQNLVNVAGDLQPLVAAMNYPDRRVRFEAAFALAESMPRLTFGGHPRVVQVLAEAVREQGRTFAVVLAPDTEQMNQASERLSNAGKFNMVAGASIDAVAEQVSLSPGVDLIVAMTSPVESQAAVAAARRHFKMMATPILVVAPSATDVPSLNRVVGRQAGVWVVPADADAEAFSAAVKQAMTWSAGAELTEAQSLAFATTSLAILRDLSIEGDTDAFSAADAKPALYAALTDARNEVVLGAAGVLARFDDEESQRAIAEAALAGKGAASHQVSLLSALAESGRTHGNKLTELHLRRLHDLVKSATGAVADAAAEAHGSLNLPTAEGVKLILTD